MMIRRWPAAAAVVGLVLVMGGCSIEQAKCGSGEYPVKLVDSVTGEACVEKGEAPPAGYVRYPEGKAPVKVGDEWDTYWETRKLDRDGREIAA